MKFLKSLFGIKVKNTQLKLSSDFAAQVKKVIELLEEAKTLLENEEVIQLLVDNGIKKREAVEIFLFLPIAFTRYILTTVQWHDSYIDYINEKIQIEKKFSETESYQIIWNVTLTYFKNISKEETILKIAGISAEFKVINKLLLDNPDTKIEDIKLSQTVILR